MTDRFRLFVPCLLWTINHERRMHRSERAKRVADIRRDTALIAQWSPFTTPVKVHFLPYQKAGKGSGKLADTANHLPPCKAVLDGIVDAGIIVDDSPEYVVAQTFYPPIKRPGFEGISIIVEEA
jgi:crossover junction endodeoxyribonuclease RusA